MRIFDTLDLNPILPRNIKIISDFEDEADLTVFQNNQLLKTWEDPHSALTEFIKDLKQFFKDYTKRTKQYGIYYFSNNVIMEDNKEFWVESTIYLQQL
jgi:hypothetical protein